MLFFGLYLLEAQVFDGLLERVLRVFVGLLNPTQTYAISILSPTKNHATSFLSPEKKHVLLVHRPQWTAWFELNFMILKFFSDILVILMQILILHSIYIFFF